MEKTLAEYRADLKVEQAEIAKHTSAVIVKSRELHFHLGAMDEEKNLPTLFFFARSCLGKVPGRAPFSQLSQQATACTIRMQIVKQINKNELDTRKRKNQSGQLISK